ncbi:ketopantoate reductase family protein [Motiliproteus sp. MSK22-1]|uniref:ketopantoate reductase family protein n=1 Tax=Motiliproteus sp. MSK22-1 TaxID=1897630 RepID=UPI000976DFD9|nr:2-dehydropantoate 2-reductase [Motiliproteus sp. MSK22-1]OMH30347.1 hypothetical protein BGP75_18355 [Motiliproteus sp. MSK22-1]
MTSPDSESSDTHTADVSAPDHLSVEKTSWHILGAGAIGTLWANYLMRNEVPVTLLCRTAEQLDSFWDNPFLTLISESRRHKYQPDTEHIEVETPISHLLVTTKSYDCGDAIDSVSHRIDQNTVVVILQNGMGPQQETAKRFPNTAIYAGTTTEGAYRTGPQQVVHAGKGYSWFGPINEKAQQLGQAPVSALLNLELDSHFDPAIEIRLWQKLAINCAINGLTAVHDCNNGELATNPRLHQQMIKLCDEFEIVARQLTLPFNQPLFDKPIIEAATAVAQATSSNFSSMLQDIRHQRKTEIDFINGFICKKAAELNIEVPHNQRLLKQVHELNTAL